jgi:ElaB/YqjD/DUF883 family membrane-anchored ribosome-binding protein
MNANTPNNQSSGPSTGRTSSGQPSSNATSKASVQSLGQTARNTAEALKDGVGDALDRGKVGIADSAYAAGDSLAEDMTRLRADMAGMQETLTKFVSEVGGETAKTMSNVGHAVASQVGSAASSLADAGADMASSAKDQVKTFASELETMARRNPLGTLAGTLVVGLIIGMMARGRS